MDGAAAGTTRAAVAAGTARAARALAAACLLAAWPGAGCGGDGGAGPFDAVADALPDAAADALADAPGDASPADLPDGAAPDTAGPDAGPDADPLAGRTAVYPTTCKVTGEPTPPPELKAVKALGGNGIPQITAVVVVPDGTGRVVLLSQPGRLWIADGLSPDHVPAPWLDLTADVDATQNESGLLGLAFAPDFATSGHLYLSYTRPHPTAVLESVIRRLTVPEPGGPPDPATGVDVLTLLQPYGNHNGGDVRFGPDGMLYAGFGDGGFGGDPLGHGQDRTTLLGAILRLDVSGLTEPLGYAIPPDNPFYGLSSARNEIWAYGLRNPWRFAFDPVDGTLWAGDVGQGEIEEIDVIVKGGNYGWNVMEGSACYQPKVGCDTAGLVLPVAEYTHAEGKSVTGGEVYRGSAIPSLYGTYLFGDYASGTIWGLTPDEAGGWTRTVLLQTDFLIGAFAVGPDGEVYVVDRKKGLVHRLEAADPDAVGAPGFPPTLTATGCFADVPSRTFAEGVLSYTVASPFWSDGAGKERGLALPEGTRLTYDADGAWTLPDGAIAIKTFLAPVPGGPAEAGQGAPLETRFLVRDGDAWRGATYRWNEAGTEATLLVGAAQADLGDLTWRFPSRSECLACHTEAAGYALGWRTAQLNVDHDMIGLGLPLNQVEVLSRLGYLEGAPASLEGLPRFPRVDDAGAPLDARVRAYLDVNCAHCHQPGGIGNATFDLRADLALPATGTCDVAPGQGDLGVPGARLVAPGDPDASVLYLRMLSEDPELRMPSISSGVVDGPAVEAVRAWIEGLAPADCAAP